MKPDPAIDDIREVRGKISAEFGHDARQMMAHYREFEGQLQAEGRYRFVERLEVGMEIEKPVLNDKPKKL
jgi:hypothetical protein